jgi:hypothetical protein
MKYQRLISASRTHLEQYRGYQPVPNPVTLFPAGARWMYDRLKELDENNRPPFDPTINYTFYGTLKYAICLAGFSLATWWLSTLGLLFIPLSIFIFYVLEVQFLFLFPLLIDHSSKPILTGIREVFNIGLLKCLCTVVPISIFMMIGLCRRKDMTRNWYIGCLAILIWYNNDVRNRI